MRVNLQLAPEHTADKLPEGMSDAELTDAHNSRAESIRQLRAEQLALHAEQTRREHLALTQRRNPDSSLDQRVGG